MKRHSLVALTLPLVSVLLVGACSSSSSNSNTSEQSELACANYAGTWELFLDVDDSDCNGFGKQLKQVFVVEQQQCELSIDSGVTGNINGQQITWSVPSVRIDGGKLSHASATAEILDGNITGSYQWEWLNSTYYCSGSTTVKGRILPEQEAASAELGEFDLTPPHPLLSPAENTTAHTFTVMAKQAEQVYLAGEMSDWRPDVFQMKANDDGSWSITLYLAPGAWQYKFVIDGNWIADENNERAVDDSRGGFNSVLVIGEESPLLSANDEIAHGQIVDATFVSSALNKASPYAVYLPPSYHASEQSYPLVVLLHGYGNNYQQWLVDGKIQHLMDNLIAKQAIKPFILLMPSGEQSYYTGEYEQLIMQELLPSIREQYRVKSGAQNSAISGVSMGGAGAFYLAHKYPEQFGLSVPLSGYFDMSIYRDFTWQNFTMQPALYLYCGEDDHTSFQTNQRLVEQLENHKVEFTYTTAEGGHTWRYWNGISAHFLSQISAFFHP
ncbi:hypothetical protein OAG1_31840 [Agarivorans sp. OAG1]|uniref:alpha/beta hydrolase-fold protein n=1 Tax=Agarivorans sp. OAG1 TaxID=3082387 RepID=UPI002B2DBDF7|nr:hypothetical protein OAG1_31840 [Agarivorans sp. OAG1]